MATCPKCFGALNENHKCPRGILSRVTHALSTVLLGGVIGVVLSYVIEERPVPALVLAAAALGAVLASAVRQAVTGRS
jgi:cation transporter-like permease